MRGDDTKDLPSTDPGETQVVDLRDVDLRDIDVKKAESRRTAPPPLPASTSQEPSASTGPLAAAAPRASTAPRASAAPVRRRSTGFYVGILAAALLVSLLAGFLFASTLRRTASPASPAPSASSSSRVITISPVEVN